MSVTPTNIAVSTTVPALTLAAGSAGGVAVAASIDPANDYLLIYTNSATATQGINRNTLLGISGQPVGLSDSQTLTNKTLTSPTISGPTLSGTITGTYTIGGTPTFPSSVATLSGTQTLTNKTLTSPTINSPTITNATFSADTIAGYTTSNTGTIYGIAVTSGVITGAGTIGSGANVTNGVQAAALATNAITLGYVAVTSNQTSITSTTAIQATGLTLTITVPSGSRRLEIETHIPQAEVTGGSASIYISLWDGTVGSGTQLVEDGITISSTTNVAAFTTKAYPSPAAGSKTYNVGVRVSSQTGILNFTSTVPGTLIVKVI